LTLLPVSMLHPAANQAVMDDINAIAVRSARLDAVVAFVTNPGAKLFRHVIDHLNGAASLTASIRRPTNLEALASIAEDHPGSIRIHTMHARVGGSPPKELLHSKLVLSERRDGEMDVLVGSHNWTGKALHGVNREASLHTCSRDDHPLVSGVRRHIEQCHGEAVPLSADNLEELLQLQQALEGDGSGVGVTGVHTWKATVIHAEARDDSLRGEGRLLVYVSPQDRPGLLERFAVGRKVDLWLYKAGTLHDHTPPASIPVLFRGKSDMLNVASSGPVTSRTVHQQLWTLDAPELDYIRGVPVKGHPTLQVVLSLERVGELEAMLYGKGHRPKLTTPIHERPVQNSLPHSWSQAPGEQVVVFEPEIIEVETKIRVYSRQRLYSDAVGMRLENRISRHTSRTLKRPTKSNLVEAKLDKGDSPFFYKSSHIVDVED